MFLKYKARLQDKGTHVQKTHSDMISLQLSHAVYQKHCHHVMPALNHVIVIFSMRAISRPSPKKLHKTNTQTTTTTTEKWCEIKATLHKRAIWTSGAEGAGVQARLESVK